MAKQDLGTAASNANDIITKGYVDTTAGTSAATASALVRRDANSRAQFADPAAAQDAATKNYVDLAIARDPITRIMFR